MKTRIISFVLILSMLFSFVPLSVYAVSSENNMADITTDSTPDNSISSDTNISRYTVLVLDDSGSMSGTPVSVLKESAMKFCNAVLNANGENKVAVVIYGSYASTACDFTNDLTVLSDAINRLRATSNTNTNDGLVKAGDLLKTIPDSPNTIKNILLLSDGLPQTGTTVSSGKYTSTDSSYYYRYANAVYNTAVSLMDKGYSLYSLGFFHSLSGSELTFGRRFMSDLQNAGYYDVVNADDLEFVFGEIAENITKKSGTFRFAGMGDNDFSSTYHYDDSYFSEDSYEGYNQQLSTMSLCLALSAFGSKDVGNSYENKSKNAKALLSEIGFQGIETNDWFTQKPEKDSIAVIAGNKKLAVNQKDYTLIALAIRGGDYGSEWASNFTIGKDGLHDGFKRARDQVLLYLSYYLANNQITGDIKLWITGFSRAAATANLVAGAIDDGMMTFPDCTLNLSDMYAYTFETPAGAQKPGLDSSIYRNIYNVINPNDAVPKVAPEVWNFGRYGVDWWIPTELTASEEDYPTKLENMKKIYDAFGNGKEYCIDQFKGYSATLHPHNIVLDQQNIIEKFENPGLTQSAFLDFTVSHLAIWGFIDRTNYVNQFQDGIRNICDIVFGNEVEIFDVLSELLKGKLSENIGPLVTKFLFEGREGAAKLLAQYVTDCLEESGITSYNEKDKAAMIQFLATLIETIVFLGVNNIGTDVTLFENIEGIGQAHYPEVCLAWMQSLSEEENAFVSSSNYRIIRINCPVDVEVYNDKGVLVAQILSDKPQNVGSSIASSVNEDGEKLIYLPAVANYTLKLSATGSGVLTYAVNEYSQKNGDITRILNYEDIDIQLGDQLSGTIPAYSQADLEEGSLNGSNTHYVLLDQNNQPLTANDDLTGNDVTNASYMVTVSTEKENRGTVTGQGARNLGNFAKVSAMPNEGCTFDGWYENEQLVSTDMEYRFRVEKDVNLVAKFSAVSYELTVTSALGGLIVDNVSGSYEVGTILKITAEPKFGYRFKNWISSDGGVFSDALMANTSFMMPANDTTITATYEQIGTEEKVGLIGEHMGNTHTSYNYSWGNSSEVSVDYVTGNLFLDIPLLPYHNLYYNSMDTENCGLGSGFTSRFHQKVDVYNGSTGITPTSNDKMVYKMDDGKRIFLTPKQLESEHYWEGEYYAKYCLRQNENGFFINEGEQPNENGEFPSYTDQETVRLFNQQGALLQTFQHKIDYREVFQIFRDIPGRDLETRIIGADRGYVLQEFDYFYKNPERDQNVRRIQYLESRQKNSIIDLSYDEHERLTRCSMTGNYTYDVDITYDGSSTRIASIFDRRFGIQIEVFYDNIDGLEKVAQCRAHKNDGSISERYFTYLDGKTIITDENGHQEIKTY